MSCCYTVFSAKNKTLDQAEKFYTKMDKACPYNFPAYMNILTDHLYENIELNIFALSSENGNVFYPFFKRSLENIPSLSKDFSKYHDIIGSWYYGGPMTRVKTDHRRLVKEFAQTFADYCEKEKILAEFVRFDPNIKNHIGFEKFYDIRVNRETVPVCLDQEDIDIWNGYKGRCRTAIRKAQKNHIEVSDKMSPDRIDAFAKIYQNEMDRKADSRHYFFSSQFFQTLVQTLPENFKYFFAYHNGRMCGGVIVYHRDDMAYDYLMATDVESWEFQPNNILLDTVINWSKSKGYAFFDLMGGREGVFKFKSAFSSLRHTFFIGRKTYNASVYNQLDQVTRGLTGKKYNPDFFPVYRQLETQGDQ